MDVDVQLPGSERVETCGVQRRARNEPVAWVHNILAQRDEHRAARPGVGLVHVSLGGIVEPFDLCLHYQRAAHLIERHGRTAASDALDLRHRRDTGEIRET